MVKYVKFQYIVNRKKQRPGFNPINKKLSEFWQNSQISENFLLFSKCVWIKIFWGKFSEICPASCTKIFCLEISQIFWKNLWVQNSQIFVRKFLRTQIFVDRIKPRVDNFGFLNLKTVGNPAQSKKRDGRTQIERRKKKEKIERNRKERRTRRETRWIKASSTVGIWTPTSVALRSWSG